MTDKVTSFCVIQKDKCHGWVLSRKVKKQSCLTKSSLERGNLLKERLEVVMLVQECI